MSQYLTFRRCTTVTAVQRQGRDTIDDPGETDMKRWIVLALFVMGLTLMTSAAQVHSADKEQRFPLLKLEQLNDQRDRWRMRS